MLSAQALAHGPHATRMSQCGGGLSQGHLGNMGKGAAA
jgi:hypothetical protein